MMAIKRKKMTYEQLVKVLQEWDARVLIIGVMQDNSINSTICASKEDVFAAIKNYSYYRLFFLKETSEGNNFFRVEGVKYENIKNQQP